MTCKNCAVVSLMHSSKFYCLTLVYLLTTYSVTVKRGLKLALFISPAIRSAQIWLWVTGQLWQPNMCSFHYSELQLPPHDRHLLNNVAKTVFSSLSQVAPLPGFSFHKSPLPLGELNMCSIGSVRVAINDTLFVLCAVSLSICLYKISKMSLANIYLESKVRYIFSSF